MTGGSTSAISQGVTTGKISARRVIRDAAAIGGAARGARLWSWTRTCGDQIPTRAAGPDNVPVRGSWSDSTIRRDGISDDIAVHGSHVSGCARPDSDLDIAVRLGPDEFDDFINKRFGHSEPWVSARANHASCVETGKVQAGEAGLHGVRARITQATGMHCDISVICIGGAFHEGPFIQVPGGA